MYVTFCCVSLRPRGGSFKEREPGSGGITHIYIRCSQTRNWFMVQRYYIFIYMSIVCTIYFAIYGY